MNEEYELCTVADFAQLRTDQIADCLADFKIWLASRDGRGDLSRKLAVVFGVPDGSITSSNAVFRWVDDGKRGFSEFRFTDPDGKTIGSIFVE